MTFASPFVPVSKIVDSFEALQLNLGVDFDDQWTISKIITSDELAIFPSTL